MPDKLTTYTIIAAFWCAFLAVLISNLAGNFVMPHEEKLTKFGYPIEAAAEEAGPAEGAGGGGARPDIKPMIAAATPDQGAEVFRKCASCHDASAGGPNKTGPNLHNIVGDTVGDRNGFKTSDSLKAIGGNWTYDKLDDYVENPKHLAPKGIMSFAGLKKPSDRAQVIKYLMSQTDNPPPLDIKPAEAAPAAAAPAGAPPAGGAAPAAAAPAAAAPAPAK